MATKKRYYPLRSPANPTKVVLVEITEEQYQAVFPEIWAARKREQRHGRCKCPVEYSWTCNADCLVCPFHVQGDTTSLEELTEHGEEWNALEVSQAEDTPLEDDLIACSQMLDLLIARFRELDPEADHIIEMMEQGLSDRKIAEVLGRKQRTFADQMKKIRRELNRLSKN